MELYPSTSQEPGKQMITPQDEFRNLDPVEFWKSKKKTVRSSGKQHGKYIQKMYRSELELVSSFNEECVEEMTFRRWEPYTIELLPDSIPLKQKTDNGETSDTFLHGTCRVIRISNPWDFYVIFMEYEREFDLRLRNKTWINFFCKYLGKKSTGKELDDYYFQNPLELYSGMTELLTKHVLFLRHAYGDDKHSPDKIAHKKKLLLGDLVVAEVKRPWGEYETSCYRGVITKCIKQVRDYESIKPEKWFLVYLVDTGEMLIIHRKYLIPMPRAFVRFRPMAVRCALNGISPCGPEWNTNVIEFTREIIYKFSDLAATANADGYFKVEFCSYLNFPEELSDKDKTNVPTEDLVARLLNSRPYFVELTFIPYSSAEKSCNINSLLLKEKYGLEWSLISQRRLLRTPVATSEGIEDEKATNRVPFAERITISRAEALCLSGFHPFELRYLSSNELKEEIYARFKHDPKLQIYADEVVYNILALKLWNPKGADRMVPYVPRPFQNGKQEKKQQ